MNLHCPKPGSTSCWKHEDWYKLSWNGLIWLSPKIDLGLQLIEVRSLEGLVLKLKLQYFGPVMQRADSLEKDSDAGNDGRQKEKRVSEGEMVR